MTGSSSLALSLDRSLTGSWSLDLSLNLSLALSLTVQYPGSRGSCWELVAVLVEVDMGAGLWWRVEVGEEFVWSSERSSNNRVVSFSLAQDS